MKKTIKINENDLRKYVKQIIKKAILEAGNVNEISPGLARKAKRGALADARSRGKSRETSRMMAVPDHKSRWEKAGPIEDRKRDQANIFKKGAQERAGNPFYDESHPDYADIKRKGMNVPAGSAHRLGDDTDEADYDTIPGREPLDLGTDGPIDFSAVDAGKKAHAQKMGTYTPDTDGPIDFSAVDAGKAAHAQKIKAPKIGAWGNIKTGLKKLNPFAEGSDDIDEYWVDKGTDPETGESLGGHKAYNHPMDLGTGFDFSKEADQPGKIKKTIGKLKNVFAGPEDKTHHDSRPGSFYATSQRAAKESYGSKENVLNEHKTTKYNFKKIVLGDK